MSSRRSSESVSSVDSEVILEAERLELERFALTELEAALSKPVAFSVRTNISFDATLYGVDAPSPNHVVSFEAREFLHIKKRFNPHWWIGRRVRIGSPLGFIPSPAKLEAIHTNVLQFSGPTPTHFGQTQATSDFPTSPTTGISGPHGNKSDDELDDVREPNLHNQTDTKKNPVQQTQIPGMGPGGKRKVFSKKPDFVAPYEIVPCMRPVVFVGPALKGYEVTDMMQKAIFDAMKKHFDGRIIVSRVSTNLSMAKRVGDLLHVDKKNVMERGRTRQLLSLLEVQQDLERIFHLASKMQLLLLDCDTVNHPSQVSKTCLAPILIYIKIGSIRVLNRLIKNRGKAQKKYAGVQTAAAEKLLQCPAESFEFIVDQNTLSAATDALCNFLEGYWNATHPPCMLSKAERLLGMESGEPDSDRPLVPMTPGHPGLSVVTKSALDAGFTSEEIVALTGARAAGWRAENGTQAENDHGLTGPHYGGESIGSDFNAINGSGRGRMHDTDAYDSGPAEDDEEGTGEHNSGGGHHGIFLTRKTRLHMGAAHAAAMAALAAGLTPKPRTVHPSLVPSDKFAFHSHNEPNEHRSQPGLAMGIGMGLASGVAATINAALFQSGETHRGGPIAKPTGPSSTVTAAVAASMRPPPLKDLGIHQVESSDGTHVYQSRSARQARQRQEELERVRREAEAKEIALQAMVGGRRRRRGRERRPRDPTHGDNGTDWHNSPPDYGTSFERDRFAETRYGSPPFGPELHRFPVDEGNWDDMADRYDGGPQDDLVPSRGYMGTGQGMEVNVSRACPPDD